MRDTAKVTADY